MIPKEELHRTREILHSCLPLFISSGDNGINVTDLADSYRLSRPSISHHLKVLKDMGLISPRKTGTQIFYRLSIHKELEKLSDFIIKIQPEQNKS